MNPTKGLEYKGSSTNSNGNHIERWYDGSPDRNRYRWDNASGCYGFDTCETGWQQFDTDQDAWYFGVWVNKDTRQIWTYAEGDFSITTCPSVEQFNAEILHMCEFYEPGFIAKAISQEGTTVYRQDRSKFLIAAHECPVE